MKRHIVALLLTGLPAGAFAQSADSVYCNALAATYEKYVNSPSGGRGNQPEMAGIGDAKASCAKNPAAGIPVLEKALREKRINLPPRG